MDYRRSTEEIDDKLTSAVPFLLAFFRSGRLVLIKWLHISIMWEMEMLSKIKMTNYDNNSTYDNNFVQLFSIMKFYFFYFCNKFTNFYKITPEETLKEKTQKKKNWSAFLVCFIFASVDTLKSKILYRFWFFYQSFFTSQ